MKKIILLLYFSLCINILYGQGEAAFGDFEFKTTVFGKTTGIFVEGEQSIKVHLKGYSELVFMFQDNKDYIGHGINGNLDMLEIEEVFKLNGYYHVIVKDKKAHYYFDTSVNCRDIVISYGNKQLLVMLDSDPYNTTKFPTWIQVFKFLDNKY